MNNLKFYRQKNKFKQKDIAKYLNISQANYSNIELEKNDIKLSQLKKLSTLYNISINELIGDEKTVSISIEDYKKLKNISSIVDKIKTNKNS